MIPCQVCEEFEKDLEWCDEHPEDTHLGMVGGQPPKHFCVRVVIDAIRYGGPELKKVLASILIPPVHITGHGHRKIHMTGKDVGDRAGAVLRDAIELYGWYRLEGE